MLGKYSTNYIQINKDTRKQVDTSLLKIIMHLLFAFNISNTTYAHGVKLFLVLCLSVDQQELKSLSSEASLCGDKSGNSDFFT